MGTVQPIYTAIPEVFHYLEAVSISIFLAEYVVRLWACTADPRYSHPVVGRLRFALTPLLVIDLLAILPFFLPLLGLSDLRFLRAVRLLARAARLGRYFRALGRWGR